MTYIVYLDEQEGQVDGETYTAAIGFRIRPSDIIRVKSYFYPLYNDILSSKLDISKSRIINEMPDLHGSCLLRDYSDDVKFKVLDALMASIKDVDCEFLRIGYFDRSFPRELAFQGRKEKLDLATLGVAFSIMDKPHEDHILVSEFDKESLRKSIDTVFSSPAKYFAAGESLVSYNLMHLVGHYHASKSELGCQIADVINYCCLKSSNPTSYFSTRLSEFYKSVSDRYIVNQIIWINDNSHTKYFPQKNPISRQPGDTNTCPISEFRHIIPNDKFLDTRRIPPVAK